MMKYFYWWTNNNSSSSKALPGRCRPCDPSLNCMGCSGYNDNCVACAEGYTLEFHPANATAGRPYDWSSCEKNSNISFMWRMLKQTSEKIVEHMFDLVGM